MVSGQDLHLMFFLCCLHYQVDFFQNYYSYFFNDYDDFSQQHISLIFKFNQRRKPMAQAHFLIQFNYYNVSYNPIEIDANYSQFYNIDWRQSSSTMGNTKSEQASNWERHSRLGEVKLVENVDNQGHNIEEMIITRTIDSEKSFNRWLKHLQKIDDSVTRQVLLLPIKTVYESTGMCGSSGIVQLKYEHYPFVFQAQLLNRKRINRFFLETELWYLLYTLVRACAKFQKYHIKVGDLHPNSILINPDGLIKIISTASFPGEETNFDKLLQNSLQTVFLAPEELTQTLVLAQYPKNIDPAIAECYSAGLCVLAAATLQDIDSIYLVSEDQRKIQQHKVNYYLKLLGERYSSQLHSTIKGLLADNPNQRTKCSDLYSFLFEHEEKILDLQPFMQSPLQLNNSQQSRIRSTISQGQGQYSLGMQGRPMFYSQNGLPLTPIDSKYLPATHTNTLPVHLQINTTWPEKHYGGSPPQGYPSYNPQRP